MFQPLFLIALQQATIPRQSRGLSFLSAARSGVTESIGSLLILAIQYQIAQSNFQNHPEQEQEPDETPQTDTHPDFYDSGLRKQATDTTLVVGTGQNVPSGMFTDTTSFQAGGYYSYFSTDDSAIRFNQANARRPLRVRIFNVNSSVVSETLILLNVDTDGKIVQSAYVDGSWTYPVVKDSGFTPAELRPNGIPESWLGTWVSANDNGAGSTNDWELMHVNDERAVRVEMFSEAATARPKKNLTCVVSEVLTPQAFMERALPHRADQVSGEDRYNFIRIGNSVYAKKRLLSQADSVTNYTQYNYEHFDVSTLSYGLTKDTKVRSELCDLTMSELSLEELLPYQGKDLLSGLTPDIYDGFDWDQCVGMPTRNPTEQTAFNECKERVDNKQDEIDALISQSVSDIWNTTYPLVTKTPFELYSQGLPFASVPVSENICDFSDPDCAVMYSLMWLHNQRNMLRVTNMSFLKVPEIQALFSEHNVLTTSQSLYAQWQDLLNELDQSIKSLRTQGILPEAGVDVVFPSDLADPRYATVLNTEVGVDQLTDYRYALKSYRNPNNPDNVRQGIKSF